MKPFVKLVMAVFVVGLPVLLSLSTFRLPPPQPLTAGNEVFSSARALEHVKVIAAQIHPAGSPEMAAVREYIKKTLAATGLTPEIQQGFGENDVEDFMGFVPYSGELVNIYARLEGSGNTNHDILMLAHYDSTLGGPGAADDASSVAVLLETARALRSQTPLVNDIIFLFVDGEEANLLGSKLFVEMENEGILRNVNLVMNFEARGNRGPSILFETSPANGWLVKEFGKAAPYPVAYSITADAYKIVSNVTDFTSFKNVGKSGLNFANLDGMETYHNPQDTAEALNQGLLQHQGSYALFLARHFGNRSLDNAKSSGDAVYFSLGKSLMVVYPTRWNLPLTLIAMILLLAALWIGSRQGLLTRKGLFSGLLVSFLMIAGAAAAGIAAQLLFSAIYFKLDNVLSLDDLITLRRTLILEGNKWIVGTLIFTGCVLFGLHQLFRRKTTPVEFVFGNLLLWTILAGVSALYLPGTSYIFLWPLMIAVIGLLIMVTTNGAFGAKYLILFSLCAFSCILIYLPVVYLLFQALTMMGAGIPIAILSLPASLVLLTVNLFFETPLPHKITQSLEPIQTSRSTVYNR